MHVESLRGIILVNTEWFLVHKNIISTYYTALIYLEK